MTEHVHEWIPGGGYDDCFWWCSCGKDIVGDDITRRLNATERLKKLMADLQEDAKDGPNEMGGPFVAVSIIVRTLEESPTT